MRSKYRLLTVLILLMIFVVVGCDSPTESKYDPPASHTLNKDGYMHAPGLNSPTSNCTSCHGSDLRGGSTAVSCYECHGKKW